MNPIIRDLQLLNGSSAARARPILYKLESHVNYCKKHNYDTSDLLKLLSQFLSEFSANKYDKSKEWDRLFVIKGLRYLLDLCAK